MKDKGTRENRTTVSKDYFCTRNNKSEIESGWYKVSTFIYYVQECISHRNRLLQYDRDRGGKKQIQKYYEKLGPVGIERKQLPI